MEFRHVFPALLRRWKFVATFVLVGAVLTAFLAVNTSPRYSATVRVAVSMRAFTANDLLQASPLLKLHIASFANMATSPSSLARVHDDVQFRGTVSQLARSVAVTPEVNSLIIQTRQSSPELAARIAEAVAAEAVVAITRVERPVSRKDSPAVVAEVVGGAVPDEAINLGLPFKVAAGAILGLLIGAAGAIVRKSLDTSIASGEEAASAAGTKVMATIPWDSLNADRVVSESRALNGPIDEALRLLRTNLQLAGLDTRLRSVAVTSALPEEGKSFLGARLACLIAGGGKSVLLIDGDLRKPEAAARLGLDNAVGVTTVLVGRADLEQVVQHHPSGLDFVGTGPLPPNPTEVLNSEAMRVLINSAGARYDLVIVDAPPVLPVADGQVIASLADAVILVAAHGRTQRDQLQVAADRIRTVGGRLAGVVMNMAPTSMSAYGAVSRRANAKSAGRTPRSLGRRLSSAAVAVASFFALIALSFLAVAIPGAAGPGFAMAGGALIAMIAVLGLERGGTALMVAASFLAPMNNVRMTSAGFSVTASDVALALGIASLAPTFLTKRLRVPSLYTAGLIGLLTFSFVASIFSDAPIGSVLAMPKLIVSTVLIPMIFLWWQPERRILLSLALAYCAGQVVSVIYGELDPVQVFRTYGLTTHVNNFGLASLLAITLLPWVHASMPRNLRWTVYPLGGVFFFGIWESGSRAALIVLILIAIVFPLLERSGRAAWVGLALATAGVMVSSSILAIHDNSALGRLLGGDSSVNSDNERTERLSEGWHAFLEHPLLGRGYTGVLVYHNIYLAVAVAIGIFGALSFALMVAAASLPLLTHPRPGGRVAYVAVAYGLFAALSTNLWDRFVWILFAIVLAVCDEESRRRSRSASELDARRAPTNPVRSSRGAVSSGV